MAYPFSPLDHYGPMSVDANHLGGKQCVPSSFAQKFEPDTAETP